MFWRRRKLPEDDQPLVPLGLISQAMEGEGSPERPPDMLDSPKDVEQSPAQPVEMRLRVSTPAQDRLQETQVLPEQGKISPPLRWPRLDEAEIARRAQGMDTAVSFPYRKPVVSAAVPDTDEFEPEPETAEPAKLELVKTSPATAPVAAAWTERFSHLLARIREFRLPSMAPLRERVHRMGSRARTSASSEFQAARERFHGVRAKSAIAIDAAKLRLADRSQAVLSQSRSGLQHLRENIRGADWSGASRAWNRIRSWQVTVRIPATNKRLISSLAQRAMSSGVRFQETMRRDSRLWASMGMAAVSALLALGFISAVRHYGPDRVEAQPTSTAATPVAEPAKIVQSSSPVAPKASVATKSGDAKPGPIATAPVTKQVASEPTVVAAKKQESRSPAQKRRVRRNTEEDDYVAKDTYVFYGSAGKPSR